jgi:hypothetical protein
LFGDASCYQDSIELWLANLLDFDAHTFLCAFLQTGFQSLNLLATLTNHNAGFRSINDDQDLVGGSALNFDTRNCCIRQILINAQANLHIFREDIFIITLGIPAGLPSLHDAEPEPNGMHFMSQKFLLFRVSNDQRLPDHPRQ